jgi:uncharacterized protein YdhG (YjbR/CyaY superfamily)
MNKKALHLTAQRRANKKFIVGGASVVTIAALAGSPVIAKGETFEPKTTLEASLEEIPGSELYIDGPKGDPPPTEEILPEEIESEPENLENSETETETQIQNETKAAVKEAEETVSYDTVESAMVAAEAASLMSFSASSAATTSTEPDPQKTALKQEFLDHLDNMDNYEAERLLYEQEKAVYDQKVIDFINGTISFDELETAFNVLNGRFGDLSLVYDALLAAHSDIYNRLLQLAQDRNSVETIWDILDKMGLTADDLYLVEYNWAIRHILEYEGLNGGGEVFPMSIYRKDTDRLIIAPSFCAFGGALSFAGDAPGAHGQQLSGYMIAVDLEKLLEIRDQQKATNPQYNEKEWEYINETEYQKIVSAYNYIYDHYGKLEDHRIITQVITWTLLGFMPKLEGVISDLKLSDAERSAILNILANYDSYKGKGGILTILYLISFDPDGNPIIAQPQLVPIYDERNPKKKPEDLILKLILPGKISPPELPTEPSSPSTPTNPTELVDSVDPRDPEPVIPETSSWTETPPYEGPAAGGAPVTPATTSIPDGPAAGGAPFSEILPTDGTAAGGAPIPEEAASLSQARIRINDTKISDTTNWWKLLLAGLALLFLPGKRRKAKQK